MDEQKKIAQKKKLNMKLYPIYRILATDVLFFGAVKVLFLTQVKGISNANVVLLETIYAFFKMVMQIPMTVVVSKLGIRRSVILGNLFWMLEVFLIMISNNYAILILAELMSSIGWSLKSITEAPLLTSSIPETNKKGKIFTKIDSKGYSKYCYISAITTIMSGFLYEINEYIPIVLSLIFMMLAFVISLNFCSIKEEEKGKNVKDSINEVKEGFIFIIKSPRLKSLLLMLGFCWAVICLVGTYQTTLLKDINVSAKYIGIILASVEIIQGISATKSEKFNEKHKNNSLTYLALKIIIGTIVAGLVVVIGLPRIPQLAIIIYVFCIQKSSRGIYKIISRKYMGNFMTQEILSKIYSVYSIITSICRMLIGAVCSYLLTIMTIDYAMVTIGILFTAIALILSTYMKKRIGLKPEEYTTKDVVTIN